jgi:hypothetical protein
MVVANLLSTLHSTWSPLPSQSEPKEANCSHTQRDTILTIWFMQCSVTDNYIGKYIKWAMVIDMEFHVEATYSYKYIDIY